MLQHTGCWYVSGGVTKCDSGNDATPEQLILSISVCIDLQRGRKRYNEE